MSMGKLSKREKILIFVLLLLVLGYAYYNFILMPQLNSIRSIDVSIENNKKMLSALEGQQENIDRNKNEMKDLEYYENKYKQNIPESAGIPEIIVYIDEMTKSSGCTPVELNFHGNAEEDVKKDNNSKTNENGIVKEIHLSYQVTGSYESIISLEKYIENCARRMIVDKLDIEKDSEGGILHAYIGIRCFYMENESNSQGTVDYPFLKSTGGKENIFN